MSATGRTRSLIVVVVLWHPETSKCHWQLVNDQTLAQTSGGGWELLVPEAQVLDEGATAALRAAAEGDPYVLRIRELRLARPWMQLVAEGNRLMIDIKEWINKTFGRGSIALGSYQGLHEDPIWLAQWTALLGGRSYDEVIPQLFAWADVGSIRRPTRGG
jgi:hypothetical protein